MLTEQHKLGNVSDKPYIFGKSTILDVIQNATKMSPYAYEYHLKNGYIPINGGHRMGICGKSIIKNNQVSHIKDVNSINIRISKTKKLFDDNLFRQLTCNNNLSNICVISPPGCGKTTFIKNYVRYIGCIYPYKHLCIIDERGEIFFENRTSEQIPYSISVMSDCPKDIASEIMLRTMSPDVIVCDEIWNNNDIQAVNNILKSGVVCVFSVHGSCFENCLNLPDVNKLKPFYAVELSDKKGKGTVENVRRFV